MPGEKFVDAILCRGTGGMRVGLGQVAGLFGMMLEAGGISVGAVIVKHGMDVRK